MVMRGDLFSRVTVGIRRDLEGSVGIKDFLGSHVQGSVGMKDSSR